MRRRTLAMTKVELAAKVRVTHRLHILPGGGYRIDQDILAERPQWSFSFERGGDAYAHWKRLAGSEQQLIEMPEDWPGADLRRR
jgi:hypothetical protein